MSKPTSKGEARWKFWREDNPNNAHLKTGISGPVQRWVRVILFGISLIISVIIGHFWLM